MEEVDTLPLELCYLSPKDEGRGDCTQGTHCAHVPVHAPEGTGMYEVFQLIHGLGVTTLTSFQLPTLQSSQEAAMLMLVSPSVMCPYHRYYTPHYTFFIVNGQKEARVSHDSSKLKTCDEIYHK